MKLEHGPIPLIYVAGPYSSPHNSVRVANIYAAWKLGAEVAALGALPVIPHKSTEQMDDLQPQAWWLKATLALMKRCDGVIFTEDFERSTGALGEEAEAVRLGLPRFYDVDALADWLRPPSLMEEFFDASTELWPGPGV